MQNIIKKMIEDKKEYKNQMTRVAALPEDYRFVFDKIQMYMWSFAGGDGSDMLKIQYELIELFESSAADGKHVLDVTGKDVAGFCDEFLRDAKVWTDKYREKLNCDMMKKLGKNTELSKLPNIGKELEQQLIKVGIKNIDDLINEGSREVWLKIKEIDPSACINRLMALEGAIQGIRWHNLSETDKKNLKEFYNNHKNI